jgi:hypothetical protein
MWTQCGLENDHLADESTGSPPAVYEQSMTAPQKSSYSPPKVLVDSTQSP